MKNKHVFFYLFLCIILMASCKKDEPPTLAPSTAFTLNGIHYTPKGMSSFDYGGGYITYTDSAISDDGNLFVLTLMSFQLSGATPPSGDYGIFTDSTSLVTPNNIEFNLYEFTRSYKPTKSYKIVPPGNGTVGVTNLSNKISVAFAAQTLIGIPYDTATGTSNGPNFNCTISAATLTEP